MTTDTLQWVTVYSNPTYLTLTSQMALFSGSYEQTALYSFRLDGRFNPLVSFGVAATLSYIATPAGTTINFDRVMVNEGGRWNSTTNAFVAPVSGNYFITFTMPAPAADGYGSCLYLTINDVTQLTIAIIETSHNGIEMARGSVMVHLNINDVVKFQVR